MAASSRTLIGVALVCSWVATSACHRNIEDFDPAEQSSPPDLARIFPPEEAAPGGPGAAGPGARGNVPPSRAEAAGAPEGEAITGTIEVSPELAGQVKPDAVLYLMARAAGVQGGPPLAVLRIGSPKFPVSFELGPENVMMQGTPFAGQMLVTARLDGDGNAMSREPDDLVGALSGPIFPGSRGVRLVLDGTQGTASSAAPLAAATARPAPAAAPSGGSISGSVSLSPALASKAPANAVLFIYARKPGTERGPPIAVTRVISPRFPVSYELSADDVMIPTMSFSGELQISARLDGDGNAMSRAAGDLKGAARSTATPGTSGVDFSLDQQL